MEYIQIVSTSKMLSNKLTINIDFGQFHKSFSDKETMVLDENGKKMVFNSIIDALNFMDKNGYEFINAYDISSSNSHHTYGYLMRRKK